VQEEVVCAREEVDVHHLGLAADLLDEVADLGPGVGLKADRDHRLQRQADGCRVDVGVKATDDAELVQPPNPPVTRRRRNADGIGQRAVRHSGVAVQKDQDSPVDLVDLG
jgi:hypothetical protein